MTKCLLTTMITHLYIGYAMPSLVSVNNSNSSDTNLNGNINYSKLETDIYTEKNNIVRKVSFSVIVARFVAFFALENMCR